MYDTKFREVKEHEVLQKVHLNLIFTFSFFVNHFTKQTQWQDPRYQQQTYQPSYQSSQPSSYSYPYTQQQQQQQHYAASSALQSNQSTPVPSSSPGLALNDYNSSGSAAGSPELEVLHEVIKTLKLALVIELVLVTTQTSSINGAKFVGNCGFGRIY